jgi:hypothetical protein
VAERGAIAVLGLAAVVLSLGCGSRSSRETAAGGPPSSAAQPCRSGDYVLRLSTNGATGGIVGIVQVRSTAGASCRLETQLHFTTEHADGSPVKEIDGNPARFRLQARLSPSAVLARDWIWRNWCGSAERFRFAAAAGRERASVRGITPPRCDDQRAPSRLMRLQGE